MAPGTPLPLQIPVDPKPLDQLLQFSAPSIEETPLKQLDSGVTNLELVKLQIAPIVDSKTGRVKETPPGQIEDGTYGGTQLALTEMYAKVEEAFICYCNVIGIETIIPQQMPLTVKNKQYQFQPTNSDSYPPHLDVIPREDNASQYEIFNKLGLVQASLLLPKIVPTKTWFGRFGNAIKEEMKKLVAGEPYAGHLIQDIEENNRQPKNRKTGTDVMRGENIGDLDDWYSDARFAQQQLTGTNPTTITRASKQRIDQFVSAAEAQGLSNVIDRILAADKGGNLFVQDFSYLRQALGSGVRPKDILVVEDKDDGNRYMCAAVSLFELNLDGRLHPLAVIADWKGSIEDSFTIFNKRLQPHNEPSGVAVHPEEKTDWPWRYAKTCAQVSDWLRHEVAVHLVHTHFVEEVIIVATSRCFPDTHPVYELLKPHWFRTLPLNAAARQTLVPSIIMDLIGLSKQQAFDYIWYEFRNFDFTGKYIPHDLRARGFPPEQLDEEKFKNYAYAKNVNVMWAVIHKYVTSRLTIYYPDDDSVRSDSYIATWCEIVASPTAGQISSFPTITTLTQLIDAVTMCIHIAAPQHTAVNYLQNYYQAFVINKPPALCWQPPGTLAELQRYTEQDLVKALPIGRARQWLLAAHVPWLLSFRVAENRSLVDYANSVWNVYKKKEGEKEVKVRGYAKELFENLQRCNYLFQSNSRNMTKGTVPYEVMDTGATAVSILI
ncbi:Lipoxygenase [Viridothelium virens]|uniref:Manganese lipoxygenase n=1 Tax=Viridothelium virens TaxID=1048519 RepID=A0A6A6HPG6_VIRVR|nr:Lipoxygenase [Viridothelium virens]